MPKSTRREPLLPPQHDPALPPGVDETRVSAEDVAELEAAQPERAEALASTRGESAAQHAEPDGDEVLVEQADGSYLLMEPEGAHDEAAEPDFGANLAETLEQSYLDGLGIQLREFIDIDKRARSKRDEQYAEGIRRTGLGNEAPGGAEFAGASKAVHPVLVEACIDFSARAMKELFPAKGPCKVHIVGKATEEKRRRADRKKTYLNWQLTSQIGEYRRELEQLLTQLPLGGSQYMKARQDMRRRRPTFEFVPIDDILLPFACADFYATPRLTHVQHLVRQEFEGRIESGLYIDPRSRAEPPAAPEETAAARATAKIEGKSDPGYNEDGVRDVYEVQIDLDTEGRDPLAPPDRTAPYVVTVDSLNNEVIGFYRNWDPNKETYEKLHWITDWSFIPWRGAYAIGLGHAIGSLAGAATGALRALLDSAHIANFPGGVKLKGGRTAGQDIQIRPTQLAELEGPATIDDIRKLAMPFPFPGPSAVLFQLLEFCVASAKGVVNTAEESIADATSQMPVGTALAMIEQGSVTFSAVHSRLHESQRRTLEILHRLDAQYLEDEETIEELGELVVYRKDFEGPLDVVPVSDPNIFSDTQRYAQQQAVLQLRGLFPGMFKDAALLERTLQLLNYPDYEEVLATPLEPEERDPITENTLARDPQASLKAYDKQDHLAHLKTHVAFMSSPVFCANPLMGRVALPKLIEHCAEHLVALYAEHARAAAQAVAALARARDSSSSEAPAPAAAEGSVLADHELTKDIGPLVQHLQAAMQLAQQMAPPPAPDPSVQVAQIREQGAVQRVQAQEQAATQRDQLAQQFEVQLRRMEDAVEQAAQQRAEQAEAARHTEEMAVAAANARTAEESERRKQDMVLISEQMRADLQRELAAAAQRHAAELEQIRGQNAQLLEVLRQALATRADAASQVVGAELAALNPPTSSSD